MPETSPRINGAPERRPAPPSPVRPAPAPATAPATSPQSVKPPVHQKPADELELLIRARYPVVYVVSYEETRLERRLAMIAKSRQKQLHVWGCAGGMRQVVLDGIEDPTLPLVSTNIRKNLCSAVDAMTHVIEQREPAIFLFLDLHLHLGRTAACDRANVRKVRDIARALADSYKTMVISAPTMEMPLELEKDVTVIDFSLPTREEVSALLTKIERDVEGHATLKVSLETDDRRALVRAASGLTLQEAENVFAKTLVNDGSLSGADVAVIVQEKQQIIRKSGILEYIERDASLGSVGGLDYLKDWLARRARSFSEEARAFGLPAPKGVLLVGVQGCGKSLCAKAVGRAWNMPIVRFDVGRVFSSFIGSSESNVRRAIQIAESVAPVVMWIDEIEKGLAGAQSSGATDGGTMSRVMATLLTWLNEKTSEVFVVATANDVSNLPPELLRKGRLDEIFFVDLPSASDRAEIIAIHLAKRKRRIDAAKLPELAAACDGFSGAEIEQAIVSALYDAFSTGGELTAESLAHSFRESVPLARTMHERITSLRRWADGRARRAAPSDPELSLATAATGTRRLES